MKKRITGIVLAVLFVLGFIPSANAQQDVIEKLKIDRIRSIQVREEGDNIFLDVKTIISNANDKEIRLRKGTFTFHFGSAYKPGKELTKKEIAFNSLTSKGDCDVVASKDEIEDKNKKIGDAEKPFFIPFACEEAEDIILKPQGSGAEKVENIVVFHVKIGRNPSGAFESLMHIMNCIGYPEIKTPRISIEGNFYLGMLSERGWSEVQSVKIEWLFTPDVQKKVDFMEGAK